MIHVIPALTSRSYDSLKRKWRLSGERVKIKNVPPARNLITARRNILYWFTTYYYHIRWRGAWGRGDRRGGARPRPDNLLFMQEWLLPQAYTTLFLRVFRFRSSTFPRSIFFSKWSVATRQFLIKTGKCAEYVYIIYMYVCTRIVKIVLMYVVRVRLKNSSASFIRSDST